MDSPKFSPESHESSNILKDLAAMNLHVVKDLDQFLQ